MFKKGEEAVKDLKRMSSKDFEDVFDGVPQALIAISEIKLGITIVEALTNKTNFLKSGGEARRALKENSISVNKAKVNDEKVLDTDDLINGKYILIQRGKKNYFVILVN